MLSVLYIVAFIVIFVLNVVAPIVALIGMLSHPAAAFERVGTSRLNWLLGVILTTVLLGPIGGLVSLYYLAKVHPKVVAVDAPA